MIDADGGPVRGATIAAVMVETGITKVAATSASGEFRIALEPASYNLQVSSNTSPEARGYYSATEEGNFSVDSDDRSVIELGVAESVAVTIQLPRFARLAITVVRANGDPLGYAAVFNCDLAGIWHVPDCTTLGRLDQGKTTLTISVPAVESYLRVTHQRKIWFYSTDAEGNLTRTPDKRTSLTPAKQGTTRLRLSIPEAARDAEVSYTLHPGENLIGWYGGDIAVADFFKQAPQIRRLTLLTPDGERVSTAVRSSNRFGFQTLEYGAAARAFVTGSEDVTVKVLTAPPEDRIVLPAGVSYFAWPGADRTPIELIRRGLGSAAITVRAERLTDYDQAPEEGQTVNRGEVIRAELSGSTVAMPSNEIPATLFSIGAEAQEQHSEFAASIAQVQDFYWDEYGVRSSPLDVFHSLDWEASTGWRLGVSGFAGTGVWASHSGTRLLAHEYFHILQMRLNHRLEIHAPSWIGEGSATYFAELTTAHVNADSATEINDRRRSLVKSLRSLKISLKDLAEVPRFEPEWYSVYGLGRFGVEWLAEQAGGSESVIEFQRRLQSAESWQDAFEQAFGLTPDDFYTQFAEYRTAGFDLEGDPSARLLGAVGAFSQTLSGRITDATGVGFAGAIVWACEAGTERCRRAISDDNGSVAFAARSGAYEIEIYTDGPNDGYYADSVPGHFTTYRRDRGTIEVGADSSSSFAIRLRATGSIAGQVLDAEGNPSDGASVFACTWIGAGCIHSTRTDELGEFDLAVLSDSYYLHVAAGHGRIGYYHAGRAGNFTAFWSERSTISVDANASLPVTMRFPEFATVSMLVTDADSELIESRLLSVCRSAALCRIATTNAGSDGASIVLPVGSYHMKIRLGTGSTWYYQPTAPGRVTTSFEERAVLELDPGESRSIEMQVLNVSTISGRLLDAAGNAVRLASILICSVGSRSCVGLTATKDDGSFSGLTDFGDYHLSVIPTDGVRGYYGSDAAGNFTQLRSARGIVTVPSVERQILAIQLPEASVVSGRILDAESMPIAGVYVSVCHLSQENCRGTTTDAAGTYSMYATSGERYLRVYKSPGIDGYYDPYAEGNFSQVRTVGAAITVSAPTAISIDIRLPEWSALSGAIIDAQGNPVAGALISACTSDPDRCVQRVRTDERGVFSLRAPPNEYRLSLTTSTGLVGYYASTAAGNFTASQRDRTTISVRRGATVPVEIQLPVISVISGRLIDADGRPVVGASFAACSYSDDYCPGRGTTDASGEYSLGVPFGDYRVWFTTLEGANAYYNSTVVGNFVSVLRLPSRIHAGAQHAQLMTIQLRERFVLAGRVLDADSKPVSGARVRLCRFTQIGDNYCAGARSTDVSGAFSIAVPFGSYFLHLSARSAAAGYYNADAAGNYTTVRSERTSIAISADTSEAITIQLPAAPTISGRIVARLLDDGRIEFGFQIVGGDRVLPRIRHFPANPTVGQWLSSSAVELRGEHIGRVRARRLANGQTEFRFESSDGNEIVPKGRHLAVGAARNRWLRSRTFEVE